MYIKGYEPEQDFYKDSKYEKNTEESPTEVETNGPETINGIVVNSLFVKIRKEPNLKSDVLQIIMRGDKIEVFDELINGFYKIFSIDGIQVLGDAFILSNFIEKG